MDEILKKLLESELLNEETKTALSESFTNAVQQIREDVTAEVKLQLTEEFVKAQEQLVEAIDAKLDNQIKVELDELKEDIDNFRDLEVEYAEKLVEEKDRMATLLGEQIDELVDKLDAFLEVRVSEEFTELQEDIEATRKLDFGRKMFEAFESEFKQFRKVDTSKVEQELAEAKDKLSDATQRLQEIEKQRVSEARQTKLASLLEGVEGMAKEQLKVILSNIPTEKLDEAYKIYAPRVVKESLDKKVGEKQESKQVVTESTKETAKVVLVTGNEQLDEDLELLSEDKQKQTKQLDRMKQLAGLTV